jgi:hypothetical protein
MKILCPTLNRNEVASEAAIAEIVPLLENRPNPYLILEKDEMTYMQTLWVNGGYDLEYQEGSIFEHYRLSELANKDDVIWALQSYLKGEVYWKARFKFVKKDIATPSAKLGYCLGNLAGRAWRFIKGR